MIKPLFDPNVEFRAQIANLCPERGMDHTPAGRMAALDMETFLVYADLYDLLSRPPDDRVAFEQQAHDLMGELIDLHKRTERAYAAWDAARWAR
jgi:hypothetical protein